MMRSVRGVKATEWLMALMLAAAPLSFFGCGDDDPPPSGGSRDHVEVFVTSGVYPGDLNGLDGADMECTNVANAASLSGTWTAWLSNGGTDAVSRIRDAEYRLVDGTTVVANDRADLTDGTLDAPINRDENGDPFAVAPRVWTGTDTNGIGTLSYCLNWESSAAEADCVGNPPNCGTHGSTGASNEEWTEVPQPQSCDGAGALYCFSDALR